MGFAIAGAAVGGALISSNAARGAADTQAGAARYASDVQKQIYDQTRRDQTSWRNTGEGALAMLNRGMGIRTPQAQSMPQQATGNLPYAGPAPTRSREEAAQSYRQEMIQSGKDPDDPSAHYDPKGEVFFGDPRLNTQIQTGSSNGLEEKPGVVHTQVEDQAQAGDGDFNRRFSMADFQKDPGYDFRMGEGQKALERSAAARGGLNSGRAMKELTRYGQDYGSAEYGKAYDRFNNDQSNRFNRLSSMAGLGQTANAQLAQSGQNYANQVGSNEMGAANSNAAAQMATANNINSTIGTGMNTWMQSQWLNRMSPQTQDVGPVY
jgi:hypothetical protein